MDPSGVYLQLMGKHPPNKTERLMTNELTFTNIDKAFVPEKIYMDQLIYKYIYIEKEEL